MIRAAGVAALAWVAACSTELRPAGPAAPPGDPGETMSVADLTGRAPRRELSIPASAATATAVVVAVTAIDNPTGAAFSLVVRVASRGATGELEAEAGRVTPFPADRAGSFTLALPEPARAALGRRDATNTARLALEPIAADRPLPDPLRVTVGELRWQ